MGCRAHKKPLQDCVTPKPALGHRHTDCSLAEERAIALCGGVIDVFSDLFQVPSTEIRSRGRENRTAAQTRHMAMYVAHVVLGLTMREVGLGFGRDRTSVVYACHLVEDMRDDIEYDRLVATAERIIGAAFGLSQPE